jgi:hypothetical protein
MFQFAKSPHSRVIVAATGVAPQFVGHNREIVDAWLRQHEAGWVALNDGAPEVMIYNPERRREIRYTRMEIKALEQVIWGLRSALTPPAPTGTIEAMLATALEKLGERQLA